MPRARAGLPGQRCFFHWEWIRGFHHGHPLHDGNSRFPEDVRNLRFTKSRGVVFQGKVLLFFVHAETPQSVRVGEFAEALELLEAGGRVKLVGDFEKCHAGIIPAPEVKAAETKIADNLQSTAYSPQRITH